MDTKIETDHIEAAGGEKDVFDNESPKVVETLVQSDADNLEGERVAELRRIYYSLSEEERSKIEKKLRLKVDIRLMPLLILFYILNYLDRNGIAQARLAGLEDDLNLVGSQYNTAVSILFVGYLLMQIPSNLILAKVRPSIYLPCCMIVWAIVSGATAGTHNYQGLVVVRFFLGFVEAPFFPGALYYLSCWYTRKELSARTALLFGGSLLSGGFGNLIAAGIIQGMEGVGHLASWRWLFIIEGVMTVGVALVSLPILPNYPGSTKWLSPMERVVAEYRLIEDIGSVDGDAKTSLLSGFKEMIIDYKVWLFMVNHYCITLAASYTYFFPTIVGTLGYDKIRTYLLTAPPYIFAFIVTLSICHHADVKKERAWHMTVGLLFAIVGIILLSATTITPTRYLALFITTAAIYVPFDLNLAWVANSFPRPAAKRAAALAFVNMLSNLGNVTGPYLFPSKDGPRYILACTIIGAMAFVSIILTWATRFCLVWENKKLDREQMVVTGPDLETTTTTTPEEQDTSKSTLDEFRYLY